ncbi:unnamed protein product, partial [Mesorhabditis spiculigera]
MLHNLTLNPPRNPPIEYDEHLQELSDNVCRINAVVIRAISLNTAPTSSLIIPQYEMLVVGKNNGEIVFVPYNVDPSHDSRRTVASVKNRQRIKSPITALAIGRRSSQHPDEEIVSISGNGFLQVIQPPPLDSNIEPEVVHTQMIHANIMSAYFHAVEKRHHMELVVVMTDRVVRTYRWDDELRRFAAVGKWELTGQITAVAIGDAPLSGPECWAKLHQSVRYVSCRLGTKKSVEVQQMKSDRAERSLIMPYRCYFVDIFEPKIQEIVILANMRERKLFTPSKELAAAATLRLQTYSILTIIDKFGIVFIYAYNEKTIKKLLLPPIIRFTSLPECVNISICHHNNCLVIAVTAHSKKVQIHTVSMDFIVDLMAEMEANSAAEIETLRKESVSLLETIPSSL